MLIHSEHDIVLANLSVCLSKKLWCSIKMNAHIVKLFTPSGRDMTLVFSATIVTTFQGELAQQRFKYKGVGKMGNYRQKSQFISEIVRDRPKITLDH